MSNYVELHGSYTFTQKVNNVDIWRIKKMAQKHGIIKCNIIKKKMSMVYILDTNQMIKFIIELLAYLNPKFRWDEEIIVKEFRGCIQWRNKANSSVKEYLYVNGKWYTQLKVERIPSMFINEDTIARTANVVVVGKTVDLFTTHDHDFVVQQIIQSKENPMRKLRPTIIRAIRGIFPDVISNIIYDYMIHLDFFPLIRMINY